MRATASHVASPLAASTLLLLLSTYVRWRRLPPSLSGGHQPASSLPRSGGLCASGPRALPTATEGRRAGGCRSWPQVLLLVRARRGRASAPGPAIPASPTEGERGGARFRRPARAKVERARGQRGEIEGTRAALRNRDCRDVGKEAEAEEEEEEDREPRRRRRRRRRRRHGVVDSRGSRTSIAASRRHPGSP
jgi:hypothetical protein